MYSTTANATVSSCYDQLMLQRHHDWVRWGSGTNSGRTASEELVRVVAAIHILKGRCQRRCPRSAAYNALALPTQL